jgi:hypothetical protein
MENGMGFIEEREMVERALALSEQADGGKPVFPHVAQRFLQARESLHLTEDDVADQWGQVSSMYQDLEFHDSEAFDVVSVQDLVTLASILRVSVMSLLFGEEPSPPIPITTYTELANKLRARMDEQAMTVDQLSELVGWKLSEYLLAPDKFADLPIFGLRWVCNAVNVDWASMLTNPAPRIKLTR